MHSLRGRVAETDPFHELREALAKATPGPWTTEPPGRTGDGWVRGLVIAATAPGKENRVYADPPGGSFPSNDLRFIALARNHLPALLAKLAEAEERIAFQTTALNAAGEALQKVEAENTQLRECLAGWRRRAGEPTFVFEQKWLDETDALLSPTEQT